MVQVNTKSYRVPYQGFRDSKRDWKPSRGESSSYCNLGNSYNSTGQYQKATEYYTRALEIAKETGDPVANLSCYTI